MVRNAVTNTTLLSIKRIGFSDFLNDGSFDGATETFHANVGPLLSIDLQYQKIVGSTPTEMTAGEKTAVDDDIEVAFVITPLLPPLEPETISTDTALSIYCYMSEISGNRTVTLPDGNINGLSKLILTQGGAAVTVDCSLLGSFTGFDLGSNNKAHLIWREVLGVWIIIDSRGLTKNV